MITIEGRKYSSRTETFIRDEKTYKFMYNKARGLGILYVRSEEERWVEIGKTTQKRDVEMMLDNIYNKKSKK